VARLPHPVLELDHAPAGRRRYAEDLERVRAIFAAFDHPARVG
jgi:hypothetical protein